MDEFERKLLLLEIKNDVKLKKAKKQLKIKIPFLVLSILTLICNMVLVALSMLNVSFFFVPFASSFFFGLTSVLDYMDIKFLSNHGQFKKYCESYTILKNGKEELYKIKTLDGKTIYIDENANYIKNDIDKKEENPQIRINGLIEKNLNSIQRQIDDLRESIDDIKYKRNSPQQVEKKINIYHLLNNCKFNYNPATEREKELALLEENLMMPGVNPLIIGPSGVGKTALVNGLVYKIQRGNVCNALKNKKIYEVSASELVSGCRFIGDFEEKMMSFVEFAQKENAIFFIDEFHSLIGLGQGANGNLDGATILKPYLANNKIKIIGATTDEEYEKIIKKDPAFERRFEIIKLSEPKDKILYNITNEIVTGIEKVNNIKLGNNDIERKAILESLVELTDKDKKHRKYDCKINNPVLIKNIITRAFAKAKINNSNIVTTQNICESLKNNSNLYDISINESIIKMNNINITNSDEEKGKTKIIKISNKRV